MDRKRTPVGGHSVDFNKRVRPSPSYGGSGPYNPPRPLALLSHPPPPHARPPPPPQSYYPPAAGAGGGVSAYYYPEESAPPPPPPSTYDLSAYESYYPPPPPQSPYAPPPPEPTYSYPTAYAYPAPPAAAPVGGDGRPRRPCRHWHSKGFCQLGESCGFGHGPVANAHPSPSPYTFSTPFSSFSSSSSSSRSNTTPCRHFTKGFCQLGNGCKFAHVPTHSNGESTKKKKKNDNEEEPEVTQERLLAAAMTASGSTKKGGRVPCRHFTRGHCQLGAACAFLHPGAESRASANGTAAEPAADETESTADDA